MTDKITMQECRRRAEVARKLAAMATCPHTQAFFLLLEVRHESRIEQCPEERAA